MYLGIDLGTSSVKVVLLNENQEIVAQQSENLTVSQPKALWSEQDPEHWWQATNRAMHNLKQHFHKELSGVKAIGLSGQQHGATLLDAAHKPLRPAMLWNDGRAMEQCQSLGNKVENHAHIIGSRLMPGFTAPKVEWVREHESEIFKLIAKIVLPKDYLRFKMTSDYATDQSDASGTSWLDVQKRQWSEAMLAACQLTQDHMPTLFEGSEVTGTVLPAVAREWGIPAALVVGGGGDNPAGAISVNVIEPGSAFLSLGTSGVYFVASDEYLPNPAGGIHAFCHCLPAQWHYMSVHLSAASCLSWLAGTLQVANPHELLLEAENTQPAESGVIFLPYLSGERTPHVNPYAKGVFFGMTHSTTRADLTRAVLEGVAFAFADGQDAMLNAGVTIDDVSVVGGGAKSLYWGKILATALNRPLHYRSNREVGSAFGAGRLAWLAANKKDAKTAFAMPPIETTITPDPALTEAFIVKQAVFRNLYKRLEDMF